MTGIEIRVVDVRCPVCGSDRVRSKVHDGARWWFVCDAQRDIDHGLLVREDGSTAEWSGAGRWYFTEDGWVEHPAIPRVFRLGRPRTPAQLAVSKGGA